MDSREEIKKTIAPMTGSGLGLSIVKRIVEKQHGKVTVESTFGKGTTFTFTVPVA